MCEIKWNYSNVESKIACASVSWMKEAVSVSSRCFLDGVWPGLWLSSLGAVRFMQVSWARLAVNGEINLQLDGRWMILFKLAFNKTFRQFPPGVNRNFVFFSVCGTVGYKAGSHKHFLNNFNHLFLDRWKSENVVDKGRWTKPAWKDFSQCPEGKPNLSSYS